MSVYKLVLHPVVADYVPASVAQLHNALSQRGFLGNSFSHDGVDAYLAGEDFLKHIIFLGCSPSVALTPEDGDNFCYIRISGPHQTPQFVQGDNALQPRCPACRQSVRSWQQHPYTDNFQCTECGHITQMAALDWRRQAGFGRLFIEIAGIFPQEAVPADQLLSVLEKATSVQWTYFYSTGE